MQPYPQPTHAPRWLSAGERHLGQTAPRERLRGGNSDVSNARGTPNGTLHARLTTKMCTTLFADRNQRLYIMPPNALHRSVSYRTCSRENPGDQSRLNSKRVDSMQTSSRRFLQQLQQQTPRQKCTSAEDLASRKLPPWKLMCARTRRGRAQTQAKAKRRIS